MTQVSKYPISKDVYERIFDVFLKTLAGLKKKSHFQGFLEEFLTPTEQIMLAKRLAIAFLLMKGYSYREISMILRVSLSTIGFVSLDLKEGEYYKKVVNKVLKNEEVEEFLNNVGEKVAALFATGGSKSSAWRYLKSEIQNRRKLKVF